MGARLVAPAYVIVHATAGDTAAGAFAWLNRVLGQREHPGSYHYVIDRDRTPAARRIYRMVPTSRVAYHAGRSAWPEAPAVGQSLNGRALGVAFANDNGSDANPADDALTPWQLEAGLWLVTVLCRRFEIPASHVLAHREVSPGRKTDPLPSILDMRAFRAAVAARLQGTAA
jgi:N-acetyl-anhydromuramyl-L-alanine amidase AmpD